MADIAVEQKETPVVEKEVVEVDAPKVVDEEAVAPAEEKVANGVEIAEKAENGEAEKAEEKESPAEEKPAHEGVNGDSVEPVPDANPEATPEAVKRKAVEDTDAAEAADETAPTPEKKSKVEEAAPQNGAAEEVVA